ncbi:DUF736 domain-containing protein [Sphingomonas sp. CROZ-RG-20F-R02-07]|uniref:DUF736 domain-containing protein n=1 Tax=Sphingomonas sp. CROZ-RG-20F-R02-07 TaxID=2914832 RepID=UPI001F5A4D99|nr:DUF736 domain-containing protein [Sphingomonas sp. CROZ-RG-20F-R02-07]
MATIGNFTATDGGFTGTLATLTIKTEVKIVRVQKDSERAPDARVYAGTTELGAAWSKVSREDRSYMAVKLDDPIFPAPIYANLVEGDDGSFNLIWSR